MILTFQILKSIQFIDLLKTKKLLKKLKEKTTLTFQKQIIKTEQFTQTHSQLKKILKEKCTQTSFRSQSNGNDNPKPKLNLQTNQINKHHSNSIMKPTVNKNIRVKTYNYKDNRLRKNHIETNYLVVDQIKRDKLIKVIEENYKKSIGSFNKMLLSKNDKIKELKSIINDYKFKVNSLEEILIMESQVKQKLQLQIVNSQKK